MSPAFVTGGNIDKMGWLHRKASLELRQRLIQQQDDSGFRMFCRVEHHGDAHAKYSPDEHMHPKVMGWWPDPLRDDLHE